MKPCEPLTLHWKPVMMLQFAAQPATALVPRSHASCGSKDVIPRPCGLANLVASSTNFS